MASQSSPCPQSLDSAVGFMSFARKLIDALRLAGKIRLAEHYSTSINSFSRFNGDADVPLSLFSGQLIQKYEQSLRGQGLVPNSTSYYMRNLRAIYNQAVERGLAVQDNPFRHVYTGVAKTVKRAVSLHVLKELRGLDLAGDPLSLLARDLFLFSFYTRGMAIVDVANLRKANLRNGCLSYRRQKTGQLITIRWEPCMQEIAGKYAEGDSDFMFPMIHSGKPDYRRQYLNAYSRLTRRLKKIGEQLGLPEPLTFHRSRHSWASVARDINVPISVISEAMGHDSEKTTRIYLDSLDSSLIDNANRDVIRLLDT